MPLDIKKPRNQETKKPRISASLKDCTAALNNRRNTLLTAQTSNLINNKINYLGNKSASCEFKVIRWMMLKTTAKCDTVYPLAVRLSDEYAAALAHKSKRHVWLHGALSHLFPRARIARRF